MCEQGRTVSEGEREEALSGAELGKVIDGWLGLVQGLNWTGLGLSFSEVLVVLVMTTTMDFLYV